MRLTWGLVLGTTILLAHSALADSDAQRRTLAGLGGVHLQLELRGEDLAKFGLAETDVRPEIESALAAAGLKLLDVEASTKTPGVPGLCVEATVVRSQDAKEYSWAVRVQLQQRACLQRSPTICESVGSWEAFRMGSVGRRRTHTMRQDVNDVVNQFVAAYLVANPKK